MDSLAAREAKARDAVESLVSAQAEASTLSLITSVTDAASASDTRALDAVSSLLEAHERASLRPSPHQDLAGPALDAQDSIRDLIAFVETLSVSSAHHALSTIPVAERRAARALLAHQVPDFFSVFGWSHSENRHSDVIRWLLDPRCAPRIAACALDAVALRTDDPETWRARVFDAVQHDAITVRREVPVGGAASAAGEGRIDLVIYGPSFLIAIENKVLSQEHSSQTEVYAAWLRKQRGHTAGIFLSPAGSAAESRDFRSMSHLDLARGFLKAAAQYPLSHDETHVLSMYLKALERSALRRELGLIRKETT